MILDHAIRAVESHMWSRAFSAPKLGRSSEIAAAAPPHPQGPLAARTPIGRLLLALQKAFPTTKASALILGLVSLSVVSAAPGGAAQRPIGTRSSCAITIQDVQDPSAFCHPATGDTVEGIGGIITGFDHIPSDFSFYIQSPGAGPWSGVNVFTGGRDLATTMGLRLGDSVLVTGKTAEASGETRITSPNGSQGNPNIEIVLRSGGNPLPLFHVGTGSELREPLSNPNAERWEGCLVQVMGSLRVADRTDLGTSNSFLVVDNVACSAGPCDSLFIDGSTLCSPAYVPPALGTILTAVRGIYGQRTRGYRIQLRDSSDVNPPPPVAVGGPRSPASPGLVLHRIRPNPVGTSGRIAYEIPESGGHAELVVYDARGRAVRTLLREFQTPGRHEVTWDRRDGHGAVVPPGIYWCRLRFGERTAQHRAVVL